MVISSVPNKLLFVDLLSPFGHEDINRFFIKMFSNIFPEIYVSWKKSYLNDELNIWAQKGIIKGFMPINDDLFIYKNKIDQRIKNSIKIIQLHQLIKNNAFDICYISSFETISMGLFFKKSFIPMLIHNHDNIEGLYKSKIKRFFYKQIRGKNINLIVYEDFFRSCLEQLGVTANIYTIRHPIDMSKTNFIGSNIKDHEIEEFVNNDYFVFGPSLSNDELLLQEIVNNFDDCETKFVLKSKKKEYKGKSVLLYKKDLDLNDYCTLFHRANAVILPFESNYIRTSGVLFDSFVFKKPSLVPANNDILKFYSQKFPNVVFQFNTVADILDIIHYLRNNTSDYFNDKFEDVMHEYSEEMILQDIRAVLSTLFINMGF